MSGIKCINLKCEYEKEPLGVQSAHPILGWQIEADVPVMQKAYEIAAASSEENLKSGMYDVWDSGKILSERTYGIEYGGRPLKSSERVYWAVRVWDQNDEACGFSETSWFEMGLLCRKDWKGIWLGFLGGMVGNGILMRHPFAVKDAEVASARAYVACVGYYEFHLNGKIIGGKKLDPATTDTSKTVLYSAYDITGDLRRGDNVLGFVLGTGFGGLPKILLQVNILYADGTKEEIFSTYGESWCVSRGPILYNALYDGEVYDARRERLFWDTPEYEDRFTEEYQRPGGWIMATVVEDPGGERVSEIMPPIRVCEEYVPKLLHTLDDGTQVYDAGYNISGWVEISVRGEAGAQVTLSFAEVLNEDGTLNKVALRTAICEDRYILKGDPDGEKYEPRFTYHGFRYFTISICGEACVTGLKAKFVHMDLKESTSFTSDNAMYEKIVDAMRRTDACNFMGIPTDCAQRDERHGWMTDPTSNAEGATYTYDVSSFFIKWLRDLYDTRDEKGYFADTAPYRWGWKPNDPQSNIPIGMPLLLHRMYGDRREMELHYDEALQYVTALMHESKDWMIDRSPYGEWACPKDQCFYEEHGPGANPKYVSFPFVSTTFFYFTLLQLEEMAKILGRSEESYFRSMAEAMRGKINAAYYHPETYDYDQGTQSANAMAVMMKLADPEAVPEIVRNIVRKVEEHDYHFTTGSVGTKAVIQVLCENGYEDVVQKIMSGTTAPSFGYMIEHDATTIWERWEADNNNDIMNSRNHPMLAQACVWFYKYLGGMRPYCSEDGVQKLLLFPLMPEGLGHVRVGMDLLSGHAMTEWKRTESGIELCVEVPQNTHTELRILKKYGTAAEICPQGGTCEPAGSSETEDAVSFMLQAGKYRVLVK